ncbi:MAG TPA: hypothetical protein VK688_07045, partial [Gemmatimonadales bacterium]|nr:hypothetical protein [Gemmatimonadales bacterium]
LSLQDESQYSIWRLPGTIPPPPPAGWVSMHPPDLHRAIQKLVAALPGTALRLGAIPPTTLGEARERLRGRP